MNAAHTFYTSVTHVAADASDPMSRRVKTKPLNQTIDPEEKRRIIGDTFMKVRLLVGPLPQVLNQETWKRSKQRF